MENRGYLRLCAALVLAGLCACGQWKVSALKGKTLATIKAGDSPGRVMIDYDESGALNLSFFIRVFNGRIYCADNILKRVQVMDIDGKPLLIVSQKPEANAVKRDVKCTTFNFGAIGLLAADSSGTVYVQNRLVPSGNVQGRGTDFSPSYVLVFDRGGNLQYTLGERGTPDIPFSYIESLEIDRKDRLFVVSRTQDTWSVYRFSGRRRDLNASFGNRDFQDNEKGQIYEGKIENIKIFKGGDNFLIAVAYYHGSRFKYRKIFDYDRKRGRAGKPMLDIPDPKNELFSLVDDKHIYLWNMENRDVKLMILSFEGNVINNVLIGLQENRLFEDVFADEAGGLYSLHAGRREIEIKEWK
jgi:hypothetical protein